MRDYWNDPPDMDGPCEMCGNGPAGDSCQCPECPECGDVGRIDCYEGEKRHATWEPPSNSRMVRNLFDLMHRYDADNPHQIGWALYKYIPCGPWTVFLTSIKDDHHVYYNDKDAVEFIPYCYGITVGSTVQGSDVECEPFTLTFPFDMKTLETALGNLDEEASFYWERDNYIWMHVDKGNRRYFIHQNFHGSVVWEGTEVPKEAEDIEERVIIALRGDDVNTETPTDLGNGWTVTEWLNGTTF